MRDRRDDERSFRGPMGMGRAEDRFRDRDRDREWERERTWRREEDMGGSRWSGASGRGGYESRLDEHGHEPHHASYGAASEGWGISRSYDRGYDPSGPGRSFDRGWHGSYGGAMRGEGWGRRMAGSDLGFSYRGHQGGDDLEDRGPHYGKGPKGYKRSDERVHEDVCDCIARQGHIDASDVEVKVENGSVILTGTVGERHHKRALEQMVERLHGVDEVRNELRLERGEQTQVRSQGAQQGGQQSTAQGHNGDQAQKAQMPNGKNARA